jgi:hypothetical protein
MACCGIKIVQHKSQMDLENENVHNRSNNNDDDDDETLIIKIIQNLEILNKSFLFKNFLVNFKEKRKI